FAQKGLDCPGYQQRLRWSTKHEKPTTTRTSVSDNFASLLTTASESIVPRPTKARKGAEEAGPDRTMTNGSALVSALSPAATLENFPSCLQGQPPLALDPAPPAPDLLIYKDEKGDKPEGEIIYGKALHDAPGYNRFVTLWE